MVVGGIGAKLLTKMGWSTGTGLGAKRDGMLEPIAVKKRVENLGVGAERRPFQDAWWEKMMNDAYGKSSSTTDSQTLFDACEGRRCRPHGSAKLARLEAQEKSSSDENVLDERLATTVLRKPKKNVNKKALKKAKKRGTSNTEKVGRIGKKRQKSKKRTDNVKD